MKKFLVALAFLSLVSCSTEFQSIYNSDSKLSSEIVRSEHDYFSVRLPVGWYKTSATEETLFELWLNVTDYSKSIVFVKINFDNDSEKNLSDIFNLVKTTKQSQSIDSKILKEEKFVIGRNLFYSFDYKNKDNDLLRTVVFKFNSSYYECTAMMNHSIKNIENESYKLFSLQNSILSSIRN